MYRSTMRSLTAVFTGAVLASTPLVVSAQSAPRGDFTADELRADYIAHGYQADAPITWWTPNKPTTFRVVDPAGNRVLMIIVYPDAATAQAARSSAEMRDSARSVTGPHA
jgi:hypothetical protein